MGRVGTTTVLLGWVVLFGIVGMSGMNWATRIVTAVMASPLVWLALYIIWVDSKKPFEQQLRFANRGKR